MGRPTLAAGISVHVIRRGVNRCAIYADDDDRSMFLRILRNACERHRTAVHAFVLMTNHYHLLATPRDGHSLSQTMKRVGERYVRYFNRRHSRIGTLWTGRYTSIPIETEQRLLVCLRYIEQNPVRAGIIAAPHEYRWSSCRSHVLGPRADWLTEHGLYQALGRTTGERRAAYRAICGISLSHDELWAQRHPPTLVEVTA